MTTLFEFVLVLGKTKFKLKVRKIEKKTDMKKFKILQKTLRAGRERKKINDKSVAHELGCLKQHTKYANKSDMQYSPVLTLTIM